MKKLLIFTILGCLLTANLSADIIPAPLEITEEDGSPSTFPYQLKVTNATLTDNGDGTASLATGGGGSGDVTGVGDCASGACFDGTSDGGTYINLYDGDSNYTQLKASNTAADIIVTLPATAGTLIHTEADPTALLTAGTDNVKDTHIDWGTGAGQVNPADFVDQDIGDITITTGVWAVEDESHSHTTTTISGIDISADTNLAGDTEVVLTGDALSIAAGITRDTEWDTIAEINTASTDADILIFQNIAVSGQTTVATDAVVDTLTLAGGGITVITTDATTDTITFTSTEVGDVSAVGTCTTGACTPTLGTDTDGNYVAAVTTSALTGLTGGNVAAEGTTSALAFDYSQALTGDVGLGANACVFGVSGLVCEGATANTIETFYVFPDPVTTDKTITFPNATDTLVGRDTTDTLTNKTLAAANNVIDADTAIALAADPANCSAGSTAGGITAAGVAESCLDPIVSTEIDTSSELYGILTDETGSASGTPLAVFNVNPVLTGATLAGILADNDDMVFEADANNDGSNKFSFTDGLSAEVASITEAGLLSVLAGIDGIGAVDIDYGSIDITDHTFVTDGTGDTEIVLPDDSIGPAEMAVGAYDLGTSLEADTLTEGGNAVYNSTEVPGGELGGTWASPTIDDSITVTGWVMGASTATTPAADDNDTSLATTAYVQTELNAAGGRSLTCASGSCDADVELYEHTKCIYWESPVATDDFKSVFIFKTAATITQLWCESDQTVNMTLQEDDGTPADIETTDLVCDATPPTQTTGFEDAAMAAGSRLDFDVASVSGTPTWASFCFSYTAND